jgi:hypothetical protein
MWGTEQCDVQLAKNDDEHFCPICIRRFRDELAHVHSTILSCGQHACCFSLTVESLRSLMEELPFSDHDEKAGWLPSHSFRLDKIEDGLECMLTAQSRATLWQSDDLTYEQKNEIYEQARRPVDVKRDHTFASDELAVLEEQVTELTQTLSGARRNASEGIFNLINSTGTMGQQLDDKEEEYN